MMKMVEQTGLDNEWIELLKLAKSMGITVEEVRLFFNKAQAKKI